MEKRLIISKFPEYRCITHERQSTYQKEFFLAAFFTHLHYTRHTEIFSVVDKWHGVIVSKFVNNNDDLLLHTQCEMFSSAATIKLPPHKVRRMALTKQQRTSIGRSFGASPAPKSTAPSTDVRGTNVRRMSANVSEREIFRNRRGDRNNHSESLSDRDRDRNRKSNGVDSLLSAASMKALIRKCVTKGERRC